MKKPVIILDIDQTLFETKLFNEILANTKTLDESEYIELLYKIEKKVFQELVIKKDILISIFSSRKELLINDHSLSDTSTVKRLKDYQIYLVADHPILLNEAKGFNKDIVTIWLQTHVNKISTKNNVLTDKIIHKLEEIIPIILNY